MSPHGQFDDMNELRDHLAVVRAQIKREFLPKIPDFYDYPIVHDLRGLEGPDDLNYQDIFSHTELIESPELPENVAFVADDDLGFGTVRMFVSTQKRNRIVFRTVDEAIEWALAINTER